MPDARRRLVVAIVIMAGCLMVAVGLSFFSNGGGRSSLENEVLVVQSGGASRFGKPMPHAAGNSRSSPPPMLDWLAGTWSQKDNKGGSHSRCDLASVITYLSSGYYVSPVGSGHYALDGGTITTWGRIVFDDEAGADRSHIDERSNISVTRLGENAMQSQGTVLYRCDKAADSSTGSAA